MVSMRCVFKRGSAAMDELGAPFERTDDGLKHAFICDHFNLVHVFECIMVTYSYFMPSDKL
jgi:hypothetical protein